MTHRKSTPDKKIERYRDRAFEHAEAAERLEKEAQHVERTVANLSPTDIARVSRLRSAANNRAALAQRCENLADHKARQAVAS